MNPQDAYKLLAAFMILIMIIVPVAYVVTSPRSDLTQTPEQQAKQEKYDPEFWVISQPFYSISDALNMTPPGVITASFVDLESMTPQMVQFARVQVPVDEVDSLYKSNTTRMFFTRLPNDSLLLLSTMFPERNDFEYIVMPDTYPPILRRQDTGAINIMGSPVIYAPDKTAVQVLEIIYSQNKTATAYDQYEGLLSKVEPAPFQTMNSSVDFASQFYLGIRETDGSYERTTAYLNVNSSALKKLNQLKANSTQRGFEQYNITRNGNYTIVKILSSDMLRVLNEEIS